MIKSFANRMAWRETRASWRHFIYFVVCIAIGVAALVGVGLFAENLDRAIQREARSLMAGDVEVRTTRPLTKEADAVLRGLEARGASRVHLSELVAMAAARGATQLVELKAVDRGYPFYGKLRVEPEGALASLFEGPAVIVEESLLIRLGLDVGDSVKLGQAEFKIVGVLKKEPDRAAGAFSFGPRVLISRAGLEATRLVQPGSRVTHRHVLKLPAAMNVRAVQGELASLFPDKTARVATYQESQPMLRRFLRQLTMYLGLVGLIALMVGGIGVASSVRAFLREKLETIAVLKAVGADARTVLDIYLRQTLFLGLVGSVAGALLGAGLQTALPHFMKAWMPIDPDFRLAALPFVRGVAMGLLTTVLFALWPLLEVRRIRPNAIFRRDVAAEPVSPRGWAVWATAGGLAAALVLLAVWQAGTWRAAGLFIGALAAALALLGGAAWLVIRIARRLPRRGPLPWRQGLANLYRPGSQAATVLVSIGVGVMLIVAIHLVEQNVLWEIGKKIPADAPSFFFIDIQPDQREGFTRLLAERGHAEARLTPLVRSRLWALNGQPIRRENYEEREHGWYFTREYVLTFRSDLPKDNVVTKGEWWKAGGSQRVPSISVEEEAAHRLGLDIGSTVEFDIQGARVPGLVTSIRKVNWGNMSTNFYFIFEPGALDGAPMTYVATARVEPGEEIPLQRAVVAAFPNVSAINIRDVLDSVARVVDRISLAVRFMAALSIVVGILVLAGALAATRFRRIYEAMILKAVGATRAALARAFAVEYALLGLTAGVIGTALASALAWGVTYWILDVPWLFQPAALAWGSGAAAAGTILVGFLSTHRILGRKPLPVLRDE